MYNIIKKTRRSSRKRFEVVESARSMSEGKVVVGSGEGRPLLSYYVKNYMLISSGGCWSCQAYFM